MPKKGESLQFLVSVHEEGTGITWQQNVTVEPESERYFLDATQDLYLWSVNAALTPDKALKRVHGLGNQLYETFMGPEGKKVLERIVPTAILLNVDETILNLPWELYGTQGDAIAQRTPFGRLVTTRIIPRPGHDTVKEDRVVRILAIANPTLDLAAGEREVSSLRGKVADHIKSLMQISSVIPVRTGIRCF